MKNRLFRKILFSFTATFLFFLFLAITIEVSSFFIYTFYPSINKVILAASKVYYSSSISLPQYSGLAEYDDQLGYILKPGEHIFNSKEFKTSFIVNSVGLRDKEQDLEKPDVVVLGDSYAMGWGVEESDSFGSVLQKKLNVKVLNAAISSYGTAREFLLLSKLKIQPKAIVIQYCENDFDENKSFVENNYSLNVMQKDVFFKLEKSHQKEVLYYPGKYIRKFFPIIIRTLKREYIKKSESNSIKDYSVDAQYFYKITEYFSKKSYKNIPIYVLDLSGPDIDVHQSKSFLNCLIQVVENNKNNNIKVIQNYHLDEVQDHFQLEVHINKNGHQKVATVLYNELVDLFKTKQ